MCVLKEVFLVHTFVGVVHINGIAREMRTEGNASAAQLARVGSAAGGVQRRLFTSNRLICYDILELGEQLKLYSATALNWRRT